jgi:hypothetical protein
MKRPFLIIAVICLVVFIVAGLFVGQLIPFSGSSGQHYARARRPPGGPSLWALVQNISALLGIVSFLLQVVQWRKRRD